MGLFTQRPEHNEEWAGLPSEPARPDSEAERLADAAPAVDALGFESVESIVIPIAPVVEVAAPAISDADPGLGAGDSRGHAPDPGTDSDA